MIPRLARHSALRTIAAAGALCGVLDGLSAVVLFRALFGSTPAQVLHGAAVHLFMNFVVIPLSRIGARPIAWKSFLSVLVVHMLVVGPSISLTTKKMCYTR